MAKPEAPEESGTPATTQPQSRQDRFPSLPWVADWQRPPQDPVSVHVARIATDTGRLRRHLAIEDEMSYANHLLDRISGHVETLVGMLWPTAADLYLDGIPIQAVLEHIDWETAKLHRTLGLDR